MILCNVSLIYDVPARRNQPNSLSGRNNIHYKLFKKYSQTFPSKKKLSKVNTKNWRKRKERNHQHVAEPN